MDNLTIQWYKDSLWSIGIKTSALLGCYGALLEFLKNVLPNENIGQFYSMWIIIPFFLISCYINKPQRKYTFKVKNNDVVIEIKIGDMFAKNNEKQASVIIPTNTTFTTTPYKNIIMPNSVQGQFTELFFKDNLSTLDDLLTGSLQHIEFVELPNVNTKRHKYPIGTTVKITTDKIRSYWLALADMNDHGSVNGKIDDIYPALNGLWDYIATYGTKDTIIMPIIGSGKTGIPAEIEELFIIIVESFLSYSRSNKISRKLIIHIRIDEVVEKRIDLQRVIKFIDYQTSFTTNKKIQNYMSIGLDN